MAKSFWRKKYLRQHVGVTERVLGGLILLALAGIGVAFAYASFGPAAPLFALDPALLAPSQRNTAESAKAVVNPFPALAELGWPAPTNIAVYTAANLWEKIDGRADLYLAYDMRTMTFGTYRDPEDESVALDVFWYDVAAPDNAFGVYQAEIAPGAEPVDIGRAGYQVGGSVMFWKGGHYLRVEAPAEEPAYLQAGPAIARALANVVPDDGTPLWADAWLPAEGRTPGSFDFQAHDVFSTEFLHDVFSAEYSGDAGSFRLFVHRADDAAAAVELRKQYRAFLADFGHVLQDDADQPSGLLVGDTVGVFDAVFVLDRYFAGAAEAGSADAARAAALQWRTRLQDRLSAAGTPPPPPAVAPAPEAAEADDPYSELGY